MKPRQSASTREEEADARGREPLVNMRKVSRVRKRPGSITWMVAALIALVVLNACGGVSAAPTRPKVAVPPAPPLAGLPAAALQGQLTGLVPLDTTLQLNIGLQIDRQGLVQAAQAIYDPSSSSYHHFLTPTQIARQFGAASETVRRVSDWLTSQGFQIVNNSPLHTDLVVQANVLQIAKAFQVLLQVRSLNGRAFFGPSAAPVLPAAIAPLIRSITGLSNFPQIIHTPLSIAGEGNAVPRTGQQPGAGDCTAYGLLGGVTRDQIAQTYALNQMYKLGFQGQGMKVGVVELGDPYSRNDVANYALCNGDQLHLRNIQVDSPLAPGAGQGEATLDLEMIAGLAPQAEILDYQAPHLNTVSFIDALNQIAADDQVQVVSASYGVGEDKLGAADMTPFNDTLELLAIEGISVFVSSGDCGAFTDGVFGQLVVSFPASAPWAIGVGGTSLQQGGGEIAWSVPDADRTQCGPGTNVWGTGGGVSKNQDFARPPWQTGSGVQNQYSNGNRQVPDVAALADNISIYYHSAETPLGWTLVGGTSAAAPMWAAGTVLVDQALQKRGKLFLGGVPTLYAIANHPGTFHPFHDITKGDNFYYHAGPGWDYTTGLGTPNFLDIARVLGAI
jgi:subtilase family serine protease